MNTQSELERYRRLLQQAEKDSLKACKARGDLPIGASRARLTTANARWMRASEYRDRILAKISELESQAKAVETGA